MHKVLALLLLLAASTASAVEDENTRQARQHFHAGTSFFETGAYDNAIAEYRYDGARKPLSTAALEPMVDLSRSRLEMVLKVLDVDGAVRRVRGGWLITGEEWDYDEERYERIAVARATEQEAMLEYQSTEACRMEFLLRVEKAGRHRIFQQRLAAFFKFRNLRRFERLAVLLFFLQRLAFAHQDFILAARAVIRQKSINATADGDHFRLGNDGLAKFPRFFFDFCGHKILILRT